MKKMLMVTSVPSMIALFNMDNVRLLMDMGYEVHVACNFNDTSIWPEEKITEFIHRLEELGVHYHQTEFARSPKDVKRIMQSFRQLDRLVKREKFRFIHCHTPVASVISRIVCHRNRVKVIYTAHGFHFYKGAPLQSWILYYLAEWLCSWWTDVLVTINKEDYKRAKKKLHAKRTVYVPGVGVDTAKFKPNTASREKKRAELGVKKKDIMLLSVGELNTNKNHETVIRALHELGNQDVKYFICGKGSLEGYLESLIRELNLEKQATLLGYCTDIPELCQAADLFVFPSLREGLPVALMEAMASGLPCIVSRIRGNTDLIMDEDCLAEASDAEEWKQVLKNMVVRMKKGKNPYGEENRKRMNRYGISCVNQKMKQVYERMEERGSGSEW